MITFILAYSQPILGEADTITYEKNVIIYSGNVKITKANEILTADKVTIHLDENKKASSAEAEGKVFYQDGKRIARADKAYYDFKKEIIRLVGNAKVEEGPNFVEADEIIYYRTEGKAVAIGKGKKVRTFYIEEKK
ncbi:lipopolysaccharide transport periplasmic protein LptA [Thermocrinis sp.]|uniref:lipopolysaccharide transport periplasmic protein LptA n=1 Tax=Thermocrinis sp. TaxID=2024383 RepID=UPI002FDCFB4F